MRLPDGDARVWPWWLERQRDPASPAFVPTEAHAAPVNVTGRSWTAVGNLDSAAAPVVDPRGLVTPAPGGWSLDWWVRSVDRWHLPSREGGTAVSQRLLDAAPVVETSMRVPGGQVVHRAWCVRDAGVESLVVEVENRSRQPVAVAFVVRPAGPEGLADVGRIDLADDVVSVGGRPALVLPRSPSRVATATADGGDLAGVLLADGGDERWPGEVRDRHGAAEAAFVLPLAHTARLRAVLALEARRRGSAAPARVDVGALPDAERVARGWATQAAPPGSLRVELPDGRLADAVAANRAALLLLHRRASSDRDAAPLLAALGRFGHHDAVARHLLGRDDPELSAPAAWVAGEHWRLTRDADVAASLVGPAAKAAHRLDRRRRRADPADALWATAAQLAAAVVLDGAGQPDAADRSRELAAGWSPVDLDPEAVLAARHLGVLAADDDRVAAALDGARRRHCRVDGVPAWFVDGVGYSAARTLRLADVELAAGDGGALERLRWALDHASPTWAWPEALHPQGFGGSAGAGHDGAAAAAFLTVVRDLLVREVGSGPALAVASLWPDDWLGQGVEVHDAPTRWGRVSWAVRWHGARPALLWHVEAHADVGGPVRLTAPGLDPSWSTDEARGEALLAPVEPAGGLPAVVGPLRGPGTDAGDVPEAGSFG